MEPVSRILLVGGNIPETAGAEAALRRAGHEVVGVATTAARVVELVELHEPDMVMACVQVMGREMAETVQAIRREWQIPCLSIPATVPAQQAGDRLPAAA
jgi:AmiR/NasT family two-component response regulator